MTAMTVALLVLLVVAGSAAMVWVCASPVRIAGAGALVLAVHPVPVAVFVAAALVLAALAACIVYRSLRASGGRLVVVIPAVVSGGVAA